MGLKRTLIKLRAIDWLMSMFGLMFLATLVFMNLSLSGSRGSMKLGELKLAEHVEKMEEIAAAPARTRRVKRASDTWTIPAEANPVVLGVPWDCTSASTLTQYPNATCFSHSSELVCTARIIQLGFSYTGTHDISRWIKKHPQVTAKIADMFENSAGQVDFEVCPVPQLSDTSRRFYMQPYSTDSISSGESQNHYYIHCDSCLTAAYTDLYFGSFFLDLPTAMMTFFETSRMRYIVTLKNPTDRVISEYFYPYIRAGTDLNEVGGQVLHDAMSAAIDQVKQCMNELGPTACVYGHTPDSWSSSSLLSESTMLYESCYYIHLYHVMQQIQTSQIYFVQIEQYQADPAGVIQDLYSFVGLNYPGPIVLPSGGHIHKPILPETVTMMDAFFSPFNTELSGLLGDTKWLYSRS